MNKEILRLIEKDKLDAIHIIDEVFKYKLMTEKNANRYELMKEVYMEDWKEKIQNFSSRLGTGVGNFVKNFNQGYTSGHDAIQNSFNNFSNAYSAVNPKSPETEMSPPKENPKSPETEISPPKENQKNNALGQVTQILKNAGILRDPEVQRILNKLNYKISLAKDARQRKMESFKNFENLIFESKLN
jgi:hypothetical protein